MGRLFLPSMDFTSARKIYSGVEKFICVLDVKNPKSDRRAGKNYLSPQLCARDFSAHAMIFPRSKTLICGREKLFCGCSYFYHVTSTRVLTPKSS